MEWIEIKGQEDADALLDLFGGFHDACVREAHFWTEHWVSENLSMSCSGNLDNRIRFHVQRQFDNPRTIELLFEEVLRINIVPTPDNYDTVIYKAILLVRDGIIYWSPEENWSIDSQTRDSMTWISAKKLLWREVDWVGKELKYGPGDFA